MTAVQRRDPIGIPTGGRFAATAKRSSGIALIAGVVPPVPMPSGRFESLYGSRGGDHDFGMTWDGGKTLSMRVPHGIPFGDDVTSGVLHAYDPSTDTHTVIGERMTLADVERAVAAVEADRHGGTPQLSRLQAELGGLHRAGAARFGARENS